MYDNKKLRITNEITVCVRISVSIERYLGFVLRTENDYSWVFRPRILA